jgi:hypothetical protein
LSQIPNSISIFPNPVTDKLSFSIEPNTLNTYEIYDYLGQIVLKGELRNEIDVSTLQPGHYVIKITNFTAKKFIKL